MVPARSPALASSLGLGISFVVGNSSLVIHIAAPPSDEFAPRAARAASRRGLQQHPVSPPRWQEPRDLREQHQTTNFEYIRRPKWRGQFRESGRSRSVARLVGRKGFAPDFGSLPRPCGCRPPACGASPNKPEPRTRPPPKGAAPVLPEKPTSTSSPAAALWPGTTGIRWNKSHA